MTTTDPSTDISTTNGDEDQDYGEVEITDVREFIDVMAQMAAENADTPVALAEGSFALYPMRDGGAMFVTSVPAGPMEGIKHTRIPPGMIRAVSILAAGGSKGAALKALAGFGKNKRREITAGE